MKAEEFLANRGINVVDVIEGAYTSEYLLRDLLESYANQKVLEALEEVKGECQHYLDTDSSGQFEMGMDYGLKTVVKFITKQEPKYKI